jgi:membrane protein YdbS with pleckstrin-like domain
VRRRLLRLLRLPERPDPPPGSEPTLTVFRASRRLYQLRVAGWAARQGLALAGILLSFAILEAIERTGGPPQWFLDTFLAAVPPEGREIQERLFAVSAWVLPWARLLEWLALGLFAVNLVWTWQLLRLDWEARWYMVSDESLRIREGLWRTHERTMTVANIQNLAVRRGPLQKLLGIADLEVKTAGGGSKPKTGQHGREHDDLHTGRFRGVDDAEALRDRIQAAMLRHRGSGLGDPEEAGTVAWPRPEVAVTRQAFDGELAAACEELLHEARGLRAAAEARSARR